MNRFTEEQMRRDCAAEIDMEVPKGVSPKAYLEGCFGSSASAREDMPADADVDFSCVVNLK